jgi:hypothetical protein
MLEAFVKLYFNYIQRKPREKALKLAEKIGKVLYLLNTSGEKLDKSMRFFAGCRMTLLNDIYHLERKNVIL